MLALLDGKKHLINSIGVPDFVYDIQRGVYTNLSVKSLFGHNDSVKNTEESIWHIGGLVLFPTAAAQLDVQSDNTNDTSTGTGARVVRIIGLDTNWDILTEDVVMNGTTTVTTSASFLRINEALVISAGTSRKNEGEITLNIGATTYEAIGVGHSQLHSAKYSIPNNHTAYVMRGNFGTTDNSKGVEIKVVTRNNILNVDFEPFPLRVIGGADLNPTAFAPLSNRTDFYINAKTLGGSGSVEMSGNFAILLENNS